MNPAPPEIPLPAQRLRSGELAALAQQLTQSAQSLREQAADHRQRWNQVAVGTGGAGFATGFARLDRLQLPVPAVAAQMLQVGLVLQQTAELLRPWEDMAARLLPVLEFLGEYSPAVALLLRQISAAGELIDFMCAQEIAALCTGLAPAPERDLADFDGLAATAIHELQLSQAPVEVRELAEQHPDLMLLEVAPGTLVAAIGDIDSADSVTTVAAGVGSNDPTRWHTQVERTRAVAQATGGSAVMWLGYQAPDSLPAAISTGPATQAGSRLRDFQAELTLRNPEQHRVVIGYSYGSVVVGEAAARNGPGLAADDVVLVGSPGVGARRAEDLQLSGTDPGVHAVTGTRDPIGLAAGAMTGVHGVDPTSPLFGAKVWDSDSDHSDYWHDPGFLAQLRTLTAPAQPVEPGGQ